MGISSLTSTREMMVHAGSLSQKNVDDVTIVRLHK